MLIQGAIINNRSATIFRLELLGATCMVVLGSVLHFAFAWLGGWPPLALVAAVNESIWEHLKLVFWPGLFWALLLPRLNKSMPGTAFAIKGITLLITSALIVLIFQTYTRILGRNLLVLDIGTFAVSILIGQLLSAWLLTRKNLDRFVIGAGLALLAIQLVAFSLFTYFPPDHWLFVEAESGMRGLSLDHGR